MRRKGSILGSEPYPYPYEHDEYESYHPGNYEHEGHDHHQYGDPYYGFHPPPAHADIAVPPPEVQAEEGLSEKERIRRAEERLLPSHPPQGSEGPSSSEAVAPAAGPSAPPDEQDEDLYGSEDATPRATYAPRSSLRHNSSSGPPAVPSAPTLEDLAPGAHASDDKQELERQHMLAEASAPPDFDAADEDAGEGGAGEQQHEPSVPTLTEEDEYGGPSAHHESLPRYER